MSHNLTLTAGVGAKKVSCDLFQTPTSDTKDILNASGNFNRSTRYFEWVRSTMGLEPGAESDHRLKVMTFLVRYPNAEFGST